MNETSVTVVGNVVAEPILRHTKEGVPVARFRLASTTRRYDRESASWRDADTLFLGVTCWRGLAENATRSLLKGDCVIATGRLVMRTYDTPEGDRRTAYEVDALAVGPDLSRGTATLARTAQGAGDEAADPAGPAGSAAPAGQDQAASLAAEQPAA